MKRTLLLVRHAKSSWDERALSDRDRPLAARGKRDAPLMGERLARDGVKPDLILSSPACRALSTARLIAAALDYQAGNILVNDRLYACDATTLLEVIAGLGNEPKCVMIVGHNPEFTELAHQLSRGITRMPTCAVAQFTFDGAPWSAIAGVKPVSVSLDYPKKE
ncbi:SixA phosphatase family protein [Aeromonas aquatica]|uniref:SixA phosphatase family protein n=1 Tax=Aeromonas aquatica TaxID=558964 RepID=UPI00286EC277|nr:histidine phosphatase family protein [Aeromonas aquatica]